MRGEHRWRRQRWWVLLVPVLFMPSSTRAPDKSPRPPAPTPAELFAETDAPFPDATASDVVSYADHVALVTAVAEADVSRGNVATPTPAGEVAVARRITFRVDRTLWCRPGAPAPPRRFDAVWWGWLLRDGRRVPFIIGGTPWVVVGAQYVMPIARDGSTFAPIQPFAVFRVTRGRVTLEDQHSPLAREIADATPAAAAACSHRRVPTQRRSGTATCRRARGSPRSWRPRRAASQQPVNRRSAVLGEHVIVTAAIRTARTGRSPRTRLAVNRVTVGPLPDP